MSELSELRFDGWRHGKEKFLRQSFNLDALISVVIVVNVLIAYSAMGIAKLTYVRSHMSDLIRQYHISSLASWSASDSADLSVEFSVQSTNASERHSINLDATNVYDAKLKANNLVGRC